MPKNNNENLIFTPLDNLPHELSSPRLREEVLMQIHEDPETLLHFARLNVEQQEALLQFCMGNRGLKITYDPFFHKIFNPEEHPDRLNKLLSSILKQPVKVIKVLPREGIRLTESSSLVVMDILVEAEDGSLINVEIQKYGYYFPIQRSFCYGADLLVRQYSRLRDEKKDSFSFDSGLPLGNLLNFIYIPLDIFHNIPHNEIRELDAWLYFLSSDEPSHIQQIVEKYPFFQELYQEIINYRYHPKELIHMYSEALSIMDRNTVNLMIDEMKQELEQLTNLKDLISNENARMAAEITALKAQLAEKETK